MIADLKDGDIISQAQIDTVEAIVESFLWIVSFCNEHQEWFGGHNPDEGAENEWLHNANKLRSEIQ